MLRIHLLDGFVVTVDGVRVPEAAWRGERSRSLLQFLATRPQGRTTRDELIEALWSHLPAEQAKGSLHVTINRLRRALTSVAPTESNEQLVMATPTGYQLAPGAWVDVIALQQLVESVRGDQSHDRATLLKQIEAFNWTRLPELQVDQPYSDWATAVRERVRRDYVSLQILRADLLHGSGQSKQALDALVSLLESEPMLESVARQAMQIAYNLGNQVLALSLFDRCRRALAEELGVSPLPETLALHARILAQQASAAAMETSAPPVLSTGAPLLPDRPTYLCIQIQGFERLHGHPAALVEEALGRFMQTVTGIVRSHGGALLPSEGSSETTFARFQQPSAAVAAAIALGREFGQGAPTGGLSLPVRQALHVSDEQPGPIPGLDLARDRTLNLASVAHGGQILLSAALATLLREAGPDSNLRDLGFHRLADLGTAEHLYQLIDPALPQEFPPITSLDTRQGNLPSQLSSFIGRRRELVRAKRLLGTTRLLTLTGVGGVGKTRLALQTAAQVALDSFTDGVWLVELAPLTDPSLVEVAVLEALGLQDQHQEPPLARLSAYLQTKQLLLILDNCEHLIEACAALAMRLLQNCPQLTVLATSREPLGLPGEFVLPLAGLPVPDLTASSEEQSWRDDDASRLFLQRMQAVQPSIPLAEVSASHVARICRRLDGIPLALELAAARARSLTVEQIAERLDDRFHLLTAGSRTAGARHQTLLATIDWSHDLLTEPERILLRRLSVFAGGCTLAMAEDVCSGEGVEASAVLDLLSQLVDRSLLVVDQQGTEVRYGMLETIRHYAADRLRQAGESEALADRHLAYFAKLVVENAPDSLSSAQKAWFDRLKTEVDNLRAALHWSLTAASPAEGYLMVTYLFWFWDARGHVREGREITNRLIARPDGPSTGPLWARAVLSAASLAFSQIDCPETLRLGNQALALLQQMDDPIYTLVCLMVLGWAALRSGDLAEAERYWDEAIEKAGFPALAYTAYQGLGLLYAERGEYDRAEAAMAQALEGAQMIGNPKGVAITLAHTGALSLAMGRLEEANTLLVDAIQRLEELGDISGVSIPLGSLARVSARMGRLEEAARLFGAVEGLKIRTGTGMVGSDLSAYQASLDQTRSALGEQFASAFDSGLYMDRTQLLTFIGSLVSA